MLLARPELTRSLARAVVTHSLTAVVAPMGYGKTTLARSLCGNLPGNTYYYAVPPGPHDGQFVWHDMCVALEAQKFAPAAALRRLGLPETASGARQALEYLRQPERAGQGEPVCIILDEYHYAADPALDAFLDRLAREAAPRLHLVLFSRTRPGVQLEELRLKGLAALFEQDVLAFSPEETGEFFRENGVEAPAAAAESQRFSEGWPAVLWMCLQSWLANGKVAAGRDIDSLLANAVFAAYSRDEQDMLLRLSVFESFAEEDAEGIAAGAGWLPVSLLELQRKNAFLTFDARTGKYQFHSIFRDFLRKRLAAAAHIDKPALYRLAGERCLARHEHINAFRLFHKAGRDGDLLPLLDLFRHFMEERSLFYFAEECFRAGMAIPWRVRLQNPQGWLAFVALYTLMWKDSRTAPLLDEAEERFRAAAEIAEPVKRRLQGEIELIRANQLFNDITATTRHYNKAIRLLKGPSLFGSKSSVWNYRSPSLTFIALREPGGYTALLKQHTLLLRAYHTLSGGKLRCAEEMLLAEHRLELGDFAGAEPPLAEALRACGGNDRLMMSSLIAAFGLARCHIAGGDAEKALPVLDALRLRAEALDVTELFDSIDVALGYAAAVLGRHEAIPRWLRDGEALDPPHAQIPHLFGLSLTVHGKALLLREDYARLAAVAGKIPDAAPIVSLFARIHGIILHALAVWHTRGQGEALELLAGAVELCRPDGLVLIPAEYGGHILPLLRRLGRNAAGKKDAHLASVLSLAERIARATACADKPRKPLLTPREREVLRHVAEGATNPVIAERLGVSVNAVKGFLSKASAKLGAFNRMDAVRRYNENGKDVKTP